MLTSDEKARIRRALGFHNAATSASISLGFPRLIQPLFLVDSAMDHLLPEAEAGVRSALAKVEALDERIFKAVKRLAAEKVGSITLNPKETNQLRRERKWWVYRLADEMGVPVQAYSLALQDTDAVHSVPIRLA